MTTTKRSGPPLGALLSQLREQAARTGQDRAVQLSHGARVAWRVSDGRITFAVSRKDKRVGDAELTVFRKAAGVPAEAERIPAEGQAPIGVDGETWWRVCWRWKVSER